MQGTITVAKDGTIYVAGHDARHAEAVLKEAVGGRTEALARKDRGVLARGGPPPGCVRQKCPTPGGLAVAAGRAVARAARVG